MGFKVLVAMVIATSAEAAWNIRTENLFVPNGFDDNDEVVVVADGYLANPCQKLTATIVRKDPVTKKIVVDVQARTEKEVCNWDFEVPFTSVVSLGNLEQGDYRVMTADGAKKENLKVIEAKEPTQDDLLYAPIDRARVRLNKDGEYEAILEGRFTDTCSTIGDIQLANSGKTLEVLPVMRQEEQGVHTGQCEPRETEFSAKKLLPKLAPGRYLLHVRSLNGQSVNDVFTNVWMK